MAAATPLRPSSSSRSDELHIYSNQLLGQIKTSLDNLSVSSNSRFPPITAPAAPSSGWIIYCDIADNQLKAIYANGDIVRLAIP